MLRIRFADGSGKAELKFLVEDVDRHWNVRVYFRRKGHAKIRLRKPPGSEEFMKEYWALMDGTAQPVSDDSAGKQPAAKGSLRWLIENYYASADYRRLEGRTRHVRRQLLDALCPEPIAPGSVQTVGGLPYASMPPSKVRLLRASPRRAKPAIHG